jgi:transcriptional regulator with XRE-family HTH domain
MLEFRIIEVFNYSNLSRLEFANKIGISNAVLSHISSGRNKASTDLIISILKNFEDVNPEWLLFGHGDMLKSQKGQNIDAIKHELLYRIDKIESKKRELEELITEFQLFIENLR